MGWIIKNSPSPTLGEPTPGVWGQGSSSDEEI